MRRIERTNAFRRDFKREKRGQFGRELEAVLSSVITLLAENKPLPERNRDHALGGDWEDHRECHLKPNLLLIYRKGVKDDLTAAEKRTLRRLNEDW